MNLLQGLSDFWLRFFADYPLLEHFFAGSLDLMEAAYLRLLETVLTLSLKNTPVFRKEFFKLLTISEDSMFSYGLRSAVDMTDSYLRNFKFLYNKIIEPTVILEKFLDFTIEEVNGRTLLVFTSNPFNWKDSGESIPGVAYTVIDGKKYLSFWIPNAEFDAADLYVHYGYLVDRYAPSTEAYKAFLEGLYFYFAIGGPLLPYVESMFHIIVGLPVARNDETLVRVDSDAASYVIVTDKNTYRFNVLVPLRKDILDTRNWGNLKFRVFESFTEIFEVEDAVTNPTAFYNALLSPYLAPKQDYFRRLAQTTLFENNIDNPSGLIYIGDPGFYIGADDDGYVPSVRPPLRHNYGFCVFRILKQNILFVRINSSVLVENVVPFVDFAGNIAANITPLKPVYVFFANILPQEFSDTFLTEEELSISTSQNLLESLLQDTVFLLIGDSWNIGDYYEYSPGLTLRHYDDDPPTEYPNTAGKMSLYIGMESVTISTTTGLKDMPLEIRKHA